MRVVEIPNHEIEVRGLERKEIKDLREFGYYRTRFLPPAEDADPDALDLAMDAVIDKVLARNDIKALDNCEPRYTSEVWFAIIKETYGEAEEEKNS